jgi:hypothetical protein
MGFKVASYRGGHFATPIRTIGSTAQSAFPLTNLAEWYKPYRQARCDANVSGTTYMGLDFGADISIAAIIALNINLSSIKFQTTNDNNWASIDNNSNSLPVSQDPLTGRYNIIYQPSAWDTNTRYVRILSDTNTETDGSDVMAVGSLLVVTTLSELVTPLADPIVKTPTETVLKTELSGGGVDLVCIGDARANITVGQTFFPASGESEVLTFLRREGLGGPFVWYMNDNNTSQVYVCSRADVVGLSVTGPNSRSISGLALREFI